MDPLDAILDALRLESAVAGIRDFGAPFGVRIKTDAVAAIHFIISGTCTARLAAGHSRQLGPGDAILLPHGTEHEVRDRPERPLVDAETLATCPVIDGRRIAGGDGPRTAFLCGGFRFARGGAHRLLDDLPALVITTPGDGSASPAMVAIQQAMAHEYGTGTAGQTAAVKVLMNAWFVAFLRTWIANRNEDTASWMAGLREERLAKVMVAIHHRYAEGWSIESLAAEAGMSRSHFAERFATTVGETPLDYLNRWRIHRAGDLLRSGQSTDATARAVGFASAPVLIRVFKRYHGITPGAWLRTKT